MLMTPTFHSQPILFYLNTYFRQFCFNLQLLKSFSLSATEDSAAVTSDMLKGQNFFFFHICLKKEKYYKIPNRYLQLKSKALGKIRVLQNSVCKLLNKLFFLKSSLWILTDKNNEPPLLPSGW